MQAEYLDRSMCGSYWVPCEIVKTDVPKTKEYWNTMEHIFGCSETELGFVIRVHDHIENKQVECWTRKQYLKFPHISEWIGL